IASDFITIVEVIAVIPIHAAALGLELGEAGRTGEAQTTRKQGPLGLSGIAGAGLSSGLNGCSFRADVAPAHLAQCLGIARETIHAVRLALSKNYLPLKAAGGRRRHRIYAQTRAARRIKKPAPVVDHGIGWIVFVDEQADLKVEHHRERQLVKKEPGCS